MQWKCRYPSQFYIHELVQRLARRLLQQIVLALTLMQFNYDHMFTLSSCERPGVALGGCEKLLTHVGFRAFIW